MKYLIFSNLLRWEISTSTDFRIIAFVIAFFKSILNPHIAVVDMVNNEIIFYRKCARTKINQTLKAGYDSLKIQPRAKNFRKTTG